MNNNLEAEELHDFRYSLADRLEINTAILRVLKKSENRWSKTALGLAFGPMVLGLAAGRIGHDASQEFQSAIEGFYGGVLACGGAIVRMSVQSSRVETIREESTEICQLINVPLPREMRKSY